MDQRLREQVRDRYAAAALAAGGGCCAPGGAVAEHGAFGASLYLARSNAEQAGASDVEFLHGTIEAVPLPDAAVDVVISDCVVNLSTDKPAVLAEAFRVLTPGGRVGVSDVVAEDHLTPDQRAEHASCCESTVEASCCGASAAVESTLPSSCGCR